MQKLKYTVLYVEDDEITRKNVSEYLNYKFDKVIEAIDGRSAYDLYCTQKPDFIITDIHLPIMNGMEFIEKIRAVDEQIPIIAVSGYSEKEKLLWAIRLNLIDYLLKPVNRVSLNKAIDETVSKLISIQEQKIDARLAV